MSCNAATSAASSDLAQPCSSTAPSAMSSRAGRASGTLSNRSAVNGGHSLRIVEDHAQRMAPAGPKPADAMPQVDAVGAARPLDRPMIHGKGNRIALPERNHLRARLHARPLLGQHELAALEVAPRLGQQERDLQRKDVLAIEVLMQAIVVAFLILQQQRRRPLLPRVMAAL